MKFLVLLSGLITIASAAVIPRDVQPIVVVDENGVNTSLLPNSWGFSSCDFDQSEGAVVCKITESWGAFGFQTPESYIGGKLFVTMKVKNEDYVQFQTQFPAQPGYFNFHRFLCTTEYKDYEEIIGDNPDYPNPVNKYAIQDASEKNNTLYIKKVIFYPPDEETENGTGGNQNGDSNTPSGEPSSGTGNNPDAPSTGTGNNPDAPSTGTGNNSGTSPSGTGNNSGTSPSGTGNNSGTSPSPTKPSPTKEADKDSGSTSVKTTLFSIVLVQIIMAFVLM